MLIILAILIYILSKLKHTLIHKGNVPRHKKSGTLETINSKEITRSRKKPQWVVDDVIKIKALMPKASCRIISLISTAYKK